MKNKSASGQLMTSDSMTFPRPVSELFCFYYLILLLPTFVMIVHKIKALLISDDKEQF